MLLKPLENQKKQKKPIFNKKMLLKPLENQKNPKNNFWNKMKAGTRFSQCRSSSCFRNWFLGFFLFSNGFSNIFVLKIGFFWFFLFSNGFRNISQTRPGDSAGGRQFGNLWSAKRGAPCISYWFCYCFARCPNKSFGFLMPPVARWEELTRADENWRQLTRADENWQELRWRELRRADKSWRELTRADIRGLLWASEYFSWNHFAGSEWILFNQKP